MVDHLKVCFQLRGRLLELLEHLRCDLPGVRKMSPYQQQGGNADCITECYTSRLVTNKKLNPHRQPTQSHQTPGPVSNRILTGSHQPKSSAQNTNTNTVYSLQYFLDSVNSIHDNIRGLTVENTHISTLYQKALTDPDTGSEKALESCVN